MYLLLTLTEMAADGSGTGSSFGPGPRRKNVGKLLGDFATKNKIKTKLENTGRNDSKLEKFISSVFFIHKSKCA